MNKYKRIAIRTECEKTQIKNTGNEINFIAAYRHSYTCTLSFYKAKQQNVMNAVING